VFDFKDLFWALSLRDYRVRYAQTILGFAWALIQPLFTLLIFIVVFEKAAKIETGPYPYAIFALSGLTVWSFFSYVLSQSGSSIIASQDMIKKIYFPRIIIPLSKSIVGVIDFSITMFFLLLLMLYYNQPLSYSIISFPLAIILLVITSLGIGIWFSALSIRFRDFQHVIPFVVQIGLYISPVAYPASLIIDNVPNWMDFMYYLNPMAGTIDLFRYSILNSPINENYIMISAAIALVLFSTSLVYFLKTEKSMADYV